MMANVIEEETKKAWEELTNKKSKKEDGKTEEPIEQTGGDEKEKEIAAQLLTGGLEQEIVSGEISVPVLRTEAVSSLDDFAPASSEKKEEKKEVRMYETRATRTYETHKREIYEETPENLLGRIVKPMNVLDLRPEPRMERIRTREESGNELNPEKAITMKYAEKNPAETLPFKKKPEISKYEF